MKIALKAPATVAQYIAQFPPDVRRVLKEIRSTIRAAAPDAEESISYRMPAYKLHGPLVYFAAFRNHIGLFPPVGGDPKLATAIAKYAGTRGNLKFPLDAPIPYRLISRVVKQRIRQNEARRNKR